MAYPEFWRRYAARTLMVVMTIASVAGAVLHWHLTIINSVASAPRSPLHKPMTDEMCYEIAAIRPSYAQLTAAFGDNGDGIDTILVYAINDSRSCQVTYWDTNHHPSTVSLDLP